MSDFVPWTPTPANLDRHAVGRPVGAGDIKRLVNEASHLLAYCTQPIADVYLVKHTSSPASITLGYTRNPGVDVLMMVVELWAANSTATFTTTVVPSSGSIGFMYPGEPGTLSPFHGASAAMQPPASVLAQPVTHVEFLDVTSLTVGSLTDLTVTNTTDTGSPNSFRRISLVEVPNGSTNTTVHPTGSDGVGVAGSWASAGNPIDSDTLTSAGGFARLLQELERARISNKRQWNLAWWEDTVGAPSRTNTVFGAFTYPTLTNSPSFKMRSRRLFESSVPSPHEGRWRYAVTGGGTAELRLKVNGTVVQTWTGLVSATFASTALADFNVPCDTANQFCRWSLEGKSTAGTLYVGGFYAREKPV